jgi:hypothetical protein
MGDIPHSGGKVAFEFKTARGLFNIPHRPLGGLYPHFPR